ncbi:hypothetical protein FACS1894204_08340 [Synergistales bacterium]|nr:hypothetical protein FACS1894204_08340 [Synergistales bacterium]
MKRLVVVLLVAVLALGFSGAAFAKVETGDRPSNSSIGGKIGDGTLVQVIPLNEAQIKGLKLPTDLDPAKYNVLVYMVYATFASGKTAITYNRGDNEHLYNFEDKTWDKPAAGSSKSVSSVKFNIGAASVYNTGDQTGGVSFVAGDRKGSSSGGGCSVLTLGALLAFAIPLVAVSAKRKAK